MQALNLGQLHNPHQYTKVEPGETKVVYDFRVPDGRVLFIDQVANNWFENTYWIWKINSERVYYKIERSIADIDAPKEFNPPFLVTKRITWELVNNSDSSVDAEVYCDGSIYKIKKNLEAL